VNFFSRVDVAEDGAMTLAPGNSKAGGYVELRAEMNVLAIMNTCMHPLDPNPKYEPRPVRVSVRAPRRPVRTIRAGSRAGERARLHAHREVLPMMVESRLDPAAAVYRQVIPAGEPWIREIQRGQYLRIVDLGGNQAVDTLFYNAHEYADRYSAQDTIREQRNLYLIGGHAADVELRHCAVDHCGRHLRTPRYARRGLRDRVQHGAVRHRETAHACLPTKLHEGCHRVGPGMEKRDITSNINFFMNVPVTPEGKLTFEDGISEPGKYVEMRAETDVLALISNCPQLNNPCNAYNRHRWRCWCGDVGRPILAAAFQAARRLESPRQAGCPPHKNSRNVVQVMS
jgi:urea carboxylase-associated protein 1